MLDIWSWRQVPLVGTLKLRYGFAGGVQDDAGAQVSYQPDLLLPCQVGLADFLGVVDNPGVVRDGGSKGRAKFPGVGHGGESLGRAKSRPVLSVGLVVCCRILGLVVVKDAVDFVRFLSKTKALERREVL